MDKFMAPIPGQSLTNTPKNYPWERPPETSNPNEAVMMYIDTLSQPDVIDDILYALEFGIPVQTLTDTMVTLGTASGWHSVDVGLIIKPVVAEYMIATAKEAGVTYKETFKKDDKGSQTKDRARALVTEALSKAPEGSDFQYLEELSQEPVKEEEPMAEEQPKGLMSRSK